MKKGILLFLFTFFIFNSNITAQGSDDASDAVYAGFDNGDNGGTGFGAWSLDPTSGNANSGFFTATSSSEIDVSTKSWAAYANPSQTASGLRNFTTSPAANDRVSIKMDNGNIDNGGVVGIGLRNANGENLIEVYFQGGDANYTVNEATGEKDSGLGYTNTGVLIEIGLVTATTYSCKITNINTTASQTVTGSLINPANGQTISQIRIFSFSAGNNSDQYFNELKHEQNVLPIELTKFSGAAKANDISLNWQTATEINNDFFTIEKSSVGNDFQSIGTIKGNGTIHQIQNYHFIDKNPVNGVNYYRLKQTDFNGNYEYSETIVVEYKEGQSIKFFPNPVRNDLTIQADLESISILIYNMTGQLVKEMNNIAMNSQFTLNVNELNSGLYQVQILDTATRKVLSQQRIVKE